MYDNLLQQKILERILLYKSMFRFKKETSFNVDNLHEFFDKEERFDIALVKLLCEGYITLKKEDGLKKVNIEEKGVFAINNNTFKRSNYKLILDAAKDWGMLSATIIIAIAAVIALQRDTSKFVEKGELRSIKNRLTQMEQRQSLNPIPNNEVSYPKKDSIHQ